MYTSLDSLIADLPRIAQSAGSKLNGSADGLYCLKTAGRTFLFELRGSHLTTPDADGRKPDTTVEAEESVILDLLAGRISPMKVILTGRVKIHGSKGKLLALAGLLKK